MMVKVILFIAALSFVLSIPTFFTVWLWRANQGRLILHTLSAIYAGLFGWMMAGGINYIFQLDVGLVGWLLAYAAFSNLTVKKFAHQERWKFYLVTAGYRAGLPIIFLTVIIYLKDNAYNRVVAEFFNFGIAAVVFTTLFLLDVERVRKALVDKTRKK